MHFDILRIVFATGDMKWEMQFGKYSILVKDA